MAEVGLTLKAHGGYDAPWLVIKAESVDEAGGILEEVRNKGVLPALRKAADEFQAAGQPVGVAAVTQVFPGAQEAPAAPVLPPLPPPPPLGTPPCPTCSGPTEQKSGTSAKGPWTGWFCLATKTSPKELRHRPVWG